MVQSSATLRKQFLELVEQTPGLSLGCICSVPGMESVKFKDQCLRGGQC